MVDWKEYKDLPPAPTALTETCGEIKTGSWRTFRPVLDKEKCIKCMTCWKFCPDASIKIGKDEYPEFKYDYCKGCGICAHECPKDAIEMVKEK